MCPLHRYCKTQQLQDHAWKVALNTPALASPLLPTSGTRSRKTPELALPRYRYLLATAQHCDALPWQQPLSSPPHVPKCRVSQWGSTDGGCLQAPRSHQCHPQGGGMLSSFGQTAGKGNSGLGLGVTHNQGWRKEEAGALAPNLSQLLLTNPTMPCFTVLCSQQHQSPGPPQGGNNFSCSTDKDTKAWRGCKPAQEPCREPATAMGAVLSNAHPLKHATLLILHPWHCVMHLWWDVIFPSHPPTAASELCSSGMEVI